MSQKPLLLLFDAHALVHRAWHAIQQPLAVSRTGEPTRAVFGFTSMLLKQLAELKPTHWAVAFDSPAPTFRKEMFPAYKEQRERAPDDLRVQFPRVQQLVEAFQAPIFEVPGYEADDLLGTLAHQASEQGADIIIVSGDSDILQLVSPRVRVVLPRAGRPFSDTQVYDEAAVQEKYGLSPHQLADLKALKGDPSDNIGGIPGIGEKTALKLLQQFGTIEGIYQNLEQVTPPKVQGILRQHREKAEQNKKLTAIVREAPVSLDLEACELRGYPREKVVELFRELEFHTLLARLPGIEEKPRVRPGEILSQDYHLVTTGEALEEVIVALAPSPAFAVDVETTERDARHAALVGISLATSPARAFYIPVGHRQGPQLPLSQVMERLRPFLEDPSRLKIAHNGKYDLTVLAAHGARLQNLAFDTMIAAYLLGEKSLGLKALVFGRLGVEMTPITALIGSGPKQICMSEVEVERVAQYACADAALTFRLSQLLEAELREQGLGPLFSEVEMPLVPILGRMEENGVALDTDTLREMSRSLGEEMERLEGEIYAHAGHSFNVNSPQQLGQVLFEEMKLARGKRTKTGYSTDAAVLEGLRETLALQENVQGLVVIDLILRYRQLMKLKSTYIDALPALIDRRTGRVHTSFNQAGTVTGRLSSSDPNLQNIPIRTEAGRRIRRAFIAPGDAYLVSGDYSQIDLRVLAHLSQDENLLSAFARDEDIHTTTASLVFNVPRQGVTPEMRRVAKTVNFGVIYGISDFGLEQATTLTRKEAARFIDAYFEKYPGVRAYLERTREQVREKGYVQTLLGRRRYIPEVLASNAVARAAAERMAINMPVQGTSADISKLAMIDLQRCMDEKGLQSKMILQVHDELVFEVPRQELEEMENLVAEHMPQALLLSVPLKAEVKVGKNWGEMR